MSAEPQTRAEVLMEYAQANRAMADVAEAYALLLTVGKYVAGHESIDKFIDGGRA